MGKIFIAISFFMLSSSFAYTDKCNSLLESMLLHQSEGSRLSQAAIDRGFNIYTGKVDYINKNSQHAKRLWELSNEHLDKLDSLKIDFKENCLK
jgi:hypothetical protein